VQGVAWMLPLVFLPAPKPADGDLWLTVLDVGQGLAIVARSRDHTLLYDTGPRYSPEADSGNRVVLPYLRAAGVNRLDGMIVTHDDIDHSGGALSVLQGIPVDWLASPLAATHPVVQAATVSKRCITGQQWTWEGVRFETLHPRAEDYARLDADNLAGAASGAPRGPTGIATRGGGASKSALKDNATCCVLRVTAHGRSVLLSADIEADVENLLVSSGAPLKSNVLIAPHHGSKTSSTPAFLEAVKPDAIVIPVGYRNRFRHPAPEVWERYAGSGAQLLRTDALGAVTLRFTSAGIVTSAQRTEQPRYWHQR
jgi:competence protein ComEC